MKKVKLEHVPIILIVIANIIGMFFLTHAFEQNGLNIKTGDRIWVGDASIWIPIVFYFFTNFTLIKKIIYTIFLALANFIITWGGYYYIFLINKFANNNDLIRMFMLFLFFFIPLLIFICVLYLLKKQFKKYNDIH